MIHVTSEWLRDQDACTSGLAAFEAEFPTGVEIDLDDRDQVVHLLRTSVCFRSYVQWLCAKLEHGRLDIVEADLTGANLTHARLYQANLTHAHLYQANLVGANLTGAQLTGANFVGANLTGADLTGADLTRADLTRAHIRRSDIVRSGQDPSIFAACVVKEDT